MLGVVRCHEMCIFWSLSPAWLVLLSPLRFHPIAPSPERKGVGRGVSDRSRPHGVTSMKPQACSGRGEGAVVDELGRHGVGSADGTEVRWTGAKWGPNLRVAAVPCKGRHGGVGLRARAGGPGTQGWDRQPVRGSWGWACPVESACGGGGRSVPRWPRTWCGDTAPGTWTPSASGEARSDTQQRRRWVKTSRNGEVWRAGGHRAGRLRKGLDPPCRAAGQAKRIFGAAEKDLARPRPRGFRAQQPRAGGCPDRAPEPGHQPSHPGPSSQRPRPLTNC